MLYMYMDITYLVHNLYIHVQEHVHVHITVGSVPRLHGAMLCPACHSDHHYISLLRYCTYCIYNVHKKRTALYRLSVVLLAAEHVQNMITSALMTRDTATDTIHDSHVVRVLGTVGAYHVIVTYPLLQCERAAVAKRQLVSTGSACAHSEV